MVQDRDGLVNIAVHGLDMYNIIRISNREPSQQYSNDCI